VAAVHDDAARDGEMDVEARARPVEHRVPSLRLSRNQLGRPVCAIAEQVGFRISRDGTCEGRWVRHDPVDRGITQAGKRHGARVDPLALGAPLVGHGLGQCQGRQK